MGIIIVAIVYTVGKELWEDIKSDWLFNVEELSFCKHIWRAYQSKISCVNKTSTGVVCGRIKCEVKRGEV
jgi:hypothetical protein